MSQLRKLGGYTIVEIMLVLVISGVIFAAAISLFSGQASETQFSQTMQDLNSEITAKLKEVSTNLSGAYQQYSCDVINTGGRWQPVLSSGGTQTNNKCIYLGKAILAPPNSSTLYIYTILGNRLIYNAGIAGGPATRLVDTNPTPAISPVNLTQTYDLKGAVIKTSQPKNSTGNTVGDNLVGYYTDLQGGSDVSIDNNPHLLSQAYNIGPVSAPYDNPVTACIVNNPGSPGVCSAQDSVATWGLCIATPNNSRAAWLYINNSSSGITTSLQFNVTCP